MKDKVSVIIPTYNREKTIENAIQSVLNQTYTNLEVICINDGSTDSSLNILDELSIKDSRIVVLDKKNEGAAKARNDGIDISRGEYIMFLDSDDWLERTTIEESYNAIIEKKSDICFFTYIREFENCSKVKNIYFEDKIFFDENECKNILCKRVLGLYGDLLKYPENLDALSPLCIKLYRSDLIKNNNIRIVDTSLICTCEDGLFNVEAFYYAKSAVYINKPLYHYRKYNPNSITTGYKKNLYNGWQNLYRLMREFIDSHECDSSFYDALDNRIALNMIGLGLNIFAMSENTDRKISEIKKIVNEPQYARVYKKLQLKYFPLHWKVFFFFCKIKFSLGLYCLIYLMNKMIG